MSSSKEMGKAFDLRLFNRVMRYTRPYGSVFFGVAVAAILLSAFSVATPLLLGQLVDEAISNRDAERLINIIVLMSVVLLGEVICQLLFTYYANWLGESVIRDLRIALYRKMLRFRMTYFDNSSIGVLVTRAVSDLQKIGEIFSQGFFTIVADLLKMAVVAVIMVVISWKLTLIVFAILPVLLLVTRWFQQSMKVAFVDVRSRVAQLNSFVQERLAGMRIVQLFTREEIEMKKFAEINEFHKKAWLKTIWYNSIFFAVAEMLAAFATGMVVWYGGLQNVVGAQGADQYGFIFTFLLLTGMLFRPLRHIADKFNTLQMGMVASNRVFSILDTDSRIPDEGTYEQDEVRGDIAFEQVVFGYKPGQPVLHGISLEVPAGSTVAIVGATGAGKSTIINLLNRFYDIDEGSIKVDGVDIREWKLPALRSHIAIVLQDVFLFADTIAKNISLSNPTISRDQIEAAARKIGIHEFINSLPGGYDFNVKERGGMLSSGQRQLIAFLRAYVSNPGILVLDEATSSIDTYSELLIQRATEEVTKGRTSIVIAHRLATIKKAETILVMDRGRIVEQGNHEELLRKGGYYKDLYEAQFKQEEVA